MTAGDDRSALVQRRTRELIALYESDAYLAYNLALRITCERDAAVAAAEQAFVECATAGTGGALLGATVVAALAEAPGAPSGGGAGDAEEESLLRSTAQLAPTRRAGLAIVCLTEKAPQDVAELLGISGAAAGRLLTDAWAELAALLGVGIDEAGTTLRGWLWAEPPAELWQRIFTRFHQALQGAGLDAEAVGAVAPAAARSRSRWRVGKLALAAGLGAAAVAAVASYAVPTLGGNGGPAKAGARAGQAADVAGQATGAAGTASQRAPLTPEELDRRRLAELHDLRVQAQRDAARSATASEKPSKQSAADAAARARVRRARARQLRRERARARQLASEPGPTARKRRPKSPPAPAPTPAPAPAPAPAPTGDALTKDEADKSCLYNPDTGTYVCPQG